jgi:hypothetical protein
VKPDSTFIDRDIEYFKSIGYSADDILRLDDSKLEDKLDFAQIKALHSDKSYHFK